MELHTFVESDALLKGSYDPSTHLLRLWFKSNPDRAYDYARMPAHTWTELKAAQSAGRYFRQNIQDQYEEPHAPANPGRRR